MALEQLSNISMPMAALLASMIGATATITASFLNLRMAWKKELQARANHKPVSKKAARGPIVPLLALLLASAVGGFALSHYLGSRGRAATVTLEAELRTKIGQLDAATQRLEKMSLDGANAIGEQAREEERRKRGADGAAAMVVLEKCTFANVDGHEACSEDVVRPLQVCAEIPANAQVSTIDLYARPSDDTRPWESSRVAAGADFGGGRFADRVTERPVADTGKLVCQELLHWNSSHAVSARMVVRYRF
jgi:hypothetical protein